MEYRSYSESRPEIASRGPRALRSGVFEIFINPENGWLSSRIKKIAPVAESAKMISEPMTIALGGANKLKLAKMMVSQNTSTTKKGAGIESPLCAASSKRVCAKSVLTFIARD
jgi:hypothetical protein